MAGAAPGLVEHRAHPEPVRDRLGQHLELPSLKHRRQVAWIRIERRDRLLERRIHPRMQVRAAQASAAVVERAEQSGTRAHGNRIVHQIGRPHPVLVEDALRHRLRLEQARRDLIALHRFRPVELLLGIDDHLQQGRSGRERGHARSGTLRAGLPIARPTNGIERDRDRGPKQPHPTLALRRVERPRARQEQRCGRPETCGQDAPTGGFVAATTENPHRRRAFPPRSRRAPCAAGRHTVPFPASAVP